MGNDNLKLEIQALFKEHNIKPSKLRGQNFLINKKVLEKIVKLTNIEKGGIVVEIGAGVGNLTEEILKTGANILAVEKDENLANILKEKFLNVSNLEIIPDSILNLNEEDIKESYKVIGNIPYYITGPILRKFLLSSNPPKLIVLTIQKEVAERIFAQAPKANFLSMMISLLAKVKSKTEVKADNFWPEPKVHSSIIVLEPEIKTKEVEKIINFLKIGFQQPRKTLLNNLSELADVDKSEINDMLKKLNLHEKIRAHELTKEQWLNIYRLLKKV